jgi:hypothetical protein
MSSSPVTRFARPPRGSVLRPAAISRPRPYAARVTQRSRIALPRELSAPSGLAPLAAWAMRSAAGERSPAR